MLLAAAAASTLGVFRCWVDDTRVHGQHLIAKLSSTIWVLALVGNATVVVADMPTCNLHPPKKRSLLLLLHAGS
jgi:hypothetical protein